MSLPCRKRALLEKMSKTLQCETYTTPFLYSSFNTWWMRTLRGALLQIQAAPKRLDDKTQCPEGSAHPESRQPGWFFFAGWIWRLQRFRWTDGSELAAKRTVKSLCPQIPKSWETTTWPRWLMKAKVWDRLVTSRWEPLPHARLPGFFCSLTVWGTQKQ